MKTAMIFARSAAAAVLVWVSAIAIIEGGGSGCGMKESIGYGCGLPTPEERARALDGNNEVPPNDSNGYGRASYELSEDGTELRYEITAAGLSGPVTAAHFHYAPASEDGPIVLDLAPFLTEVNGEVALIGASSLADWTIENVAEEIRAGRVYVNLHTAAYPDGEIRGQVLVPPLMR